jgi:hypothetical protein
VTFWGFDLEDFGAGIAEQLGAIGAGDVLGEVHHSDTGERVERAPGHSANNIESDRLSLGPSDGYDTVRLNIRRPSGWPVRLFREGAMMRWP